MSDSLSIGSAAQTITFNEIPASWRDPNVLVELRPNYGKTGLLLLPSMALIVGQLLAGSTAIPGALYAIAAPGQAEALFGAGSIAATMINTWRVNNTTTPLFASALADVTGASKASITLPFPTATYPGGYAVTVNIGGMPVTAVIPGGTSQTDLANAVVAIVNATPALLVTAAIGPALPSGGGSTVVLTAKNAGLCGNEIAVRAAAQLTSAPGLVTKYGNLAGGLGNPDIGPIITAMGGTWFTDVVVPWTDPTNRAEVAAEGVRRFGAMVNLNARFWQGTIGSYATVTAYGDAGNSIQMCTVPVRGNLEPGWLWAAGWGAVHAFRLANDPSRQSKGIAVAGLTAPDPSDRWLPQERDLLLRNGLSTWTALSDGTVVISRTITGYLTSNLGVADAAWLDIMTSATMSAIRYDWRAYVKLVYPQAKLFDDDSIGAEYDDTAATPRRIRGSWAKRCLDYERAGWIEGSATTVQQGYFVRNASDPNRLDEEMTVTIAGNLMVDASVLEFTA